MTHFRTAALAAALLVNGTAFAAIASPTNVTTGDGELFFTLFDDTAKVSYTLDLGVASKAFRTLADGNRPAAVAGDGVTTVLGSTAQYIATPWGFDGTTGSEFDKFVKASNQANWRFFIAGADGVGTSGANSRSIVTTLTNGISLAGVSTSNSSFNTAQAAFDTFLNTGAVGKGDAANQNVAFSANGSIFGTSSDGSYALSTGDFGIDGASFLGYTTDNAWNERSRFVYMTRSGTSQIGTVRTDFFDNDVGFGEFYIVNNAGSYELQYVLSAVPEPGTYGLMAAGLLVLGALARRRRA